MLQFLGFRTSGILSDVWRDRRAISSLVFAVSLPIMLLFAGLAIDVSLWLKARDNAQNAADTGAQSAMISEIANDSPDRQKAEGYAIAAAAGYVDNQVSNNFPNSGTTSVTVEHPVAPSAYVNDTSAWEVAINQPLIKIFSVGAVSSTPKMSVVAVVAKKIPENPCYLALNPTSSSAFSTNGTSTVTLTDCNLDVASTAMNGLNTTNGAIISGTGSASVNVGGTYTGSAITSGTPLNQNVSGLVDPYQAEAAAAINSLNLASPAGGCGSVPGSGSFDASKSGVVVGGENVICYSGDIQGGNFATPGIYILEGNIALQGNSSLTQTSPGVTVIVDNPASGGNSFGIQGNGSMTITAPTSGPTQGLALWNYSPNVPTSDTIGGNGALTLTGAVYAPNSSITFNGTPATPGICTQIIGNTISLTGSPSDSGTNCAADGVLGFSTLTTPRLVE